MVKRGWTLIEVLIVIAVVAIASAVLVPALANAKEAARKSSDLNNARQIGLGLAIYLSENDEVFPAAYRHRAFAEPPFGGPVAGYVHWSAALFPYLRNWKVFVSPGDRLGGHAPACFASADRNSGAGWPNGQWPDLCPAGDRRVPNARVVGGFVVDDQAPRLSYTANAAVMPPLEDVAEAAAAGVRPVAKSRIERPGSTLVVMGLVDSRECLDGPAGAERTPSRSHRPANAASVDPANRVAWKGDRSDGARAPLWALSWARVGASPDAPLLRCRTRPREDDPRITYTSWNRWNGRGDNYVYADGSAKYQNFGATLDPANYQWGAVIWSSAREPALLDPETGRPVEQR